MLNISTKNQELLREDENQQLLRENKNFLKMRRQSLLDNFSQLLEYTDQCTLRSMFIVTLSSSNWTFHDEWKRREHLSVVLQRIENKYFTANYFKL